MRVKIGDTWYDSENEPICIQISETEQAQIAAMDRSVSINGKYAKFPESFHGGSLCGKKMIEWMEG